MEIKSFNLIKEDGKRNVKLANSLRSEMFNKIKDILADEGFEVTVAANGDIAVKTAVDAATGDVFYTRLAVSFSNKSLDAKVERKAKAKAEDEVMPTLFD